MARPFAAPGSPDQIDQTEILLQGLIAECHAMIREQVRPGYDACQDPLRRDYFVSSAVSLTNAAMRMGKAIARLRGVQPAAPELRQRITVERIQRLSAPEGEGE